MDQEIEIIKWKGNFKNISKIVVIISILLLVLLTLFDLYGNSLKSNIQQQERIKIEFEQNEEKQKQIKQIIDNYTQKKQQEYKDTHGGKRATIFSSKCLL